MTALGFATDCHCWDCRLRLLYSCCSARTVSALKQPTCLEPAFRLQPPPCYLTTPAPWFRLTQPTRLAAADCVFTAFVQPVLIAFGTWSLVNWVWLLELLSGVFYCTNIVVQASTVYTLRNNHHVVRLTSGRLIARYYITRGTFVLDMLSSVPLFVLLGLSGAQQVDRDSYTYDVFAAVRMLRLLRVLPMMVAAVRGER